VFPCHSSNRQFGDLVLDKSNVLSIFAEALTAHVESVLADDGVRVGADAAQTSSLGELEGASVHNSSHAD
jgi:hypothetical protein